MSIHDGHRQRLKQLFRDNGLDNFYENQALELLLYYCIPRKDTNPIAHALLDRFGSISQVLEAPVEELMQVEGVGEHAATFLHLITEISRYYLVKREQNQKILPTLEDCARYLLPHFYGRRNETVFLLCLDAKCKVLSCRELGEGSVNAAGISVRKIMETAIREGASTVVLAHNHPSGIAVPSTDDIQTTRRIAMALSAVGIHLADHIVVADEDYVSMVQSGHRFDDCIVI